MKNLSNILLVFILISTFVACSSTYQRSESIEAKMARYQSQTQKESNVPSLQVMDPIFKSMRQSRMPASIEPELASKKTNINYSNKRLYFLTLLSQYNQLRTFSERTTAKISICPNFHTAIVNHGEKANDMPKRSIKINFNKITNSNKEELLALFPELALPMSETGNYPKVIDLLQQQKTESSQQMVQKALEIHIVKTHNELQELCEHGSSNNYYTFENLVTQIDQFHSFRPSSKNLQLLYKTTIFTNMALINSLKIPISSASNRMASTNGDQFSNDVLNRIKAKWIKKYFQEIRKKRKN